MDRRQFLQLSGLFAATAATGSCTHQTPRHRQPEKLTHPGEKLLPTNASVIDVVQGRQRRERQVLIQNGRIVDLIPPEAAFPAGADREVDLQGAYILPGLMNSHCHMTLPGGTGFGPGFILSYKRQPERNAEECIKHGVTTVRDMLAVSDFLDELKDKISAGEILGPRIHWCCAMDLKDGYTGRLPAFKRKRFWRVVSKPEDAQDTVHRAVDQGADFIKLFQQPRELVLPGGKIPTMNRKTLHAIRREADRHGKYVAIHHPSRG